MNSIKFKKNKKKFLNIMMEICLIISKSMQAQLWIKLNSILKIFRSQG